MRLMAERSLLWCLSLAGVAFVLATVGFEFDILAWLTWGLLALAVACTGALFAEAKGVAFSDNRFKWHIVGWIIGAIIGVILWSFAQKWAQTALPGLKEYRKM